MAPRGQALCWMKRAASKWTLARASAWSPTALAGRGFLSSAARFTPPSGLRRANLWWIRLPPSPSISAASTPCTWTIPARASCAPPWAGLASSSTARNPSSPREPFAKRAPRSRSRLRLHPARGRFRRGPPAHHHGLGWLQAQRPGILHPRGSRLQNAPQDRDLGCVYTLHVDDSGAGLLRTTMGWVGFKLNGQESFIPAGAVCKTRPKIGPGTPYMEDAPASFLDALS